MKWFKVHFKILDVDGKECIYPIGDEIEAQNETQAVFKAWSLFFVENREELYRIESAQILAVEDKTELIRDIKADYQRRAFSGD